MRPPGRWAAPPLAGLVGLRAPWPGPTRLRCVGGTTRRREWAAREPAGAEPDPMLLAVVVGGGIAVAGGCSWLTTHCCAAELVPEGRAGDEVHIVDSTAGTLRQDGSACFPMEERGSALLGTITRLRVPLQSLWAGGGRRSLPSHRSNPPPRPDSQRTASSSPALSSPSQLFSSRLNAARETQSIGPAHAVPPAPPCGIGAGGKHAGCSSGAAGLPSSPAPAFT